MTASEAPAPRATARDYARMARPDHWVKQLFVLPGAALALLLGASAPPWEALPALAWALASTCCAASANYVLNEWLDREGDALHPVKRARPAVAKDVRAPAVYALYAALGAAALAMGAAAGAPVACMSACLLALGAAYNVRPVRLKDVAYVDVLAESANSAVRLLSGFFACAHGVLPPVSAVAGYWAAGAFLMAAKRLSELRELGDAAAPYRRSFARYTERSLLASCVFYATAASFSIGVFLVKYRVEYVVAVPVMCALFGCYAAMSLDEGSAAQAPEKLHRQPLVVALAAAFAVLVAVFSAVDVPALCVLTSTDLVALP